MIHLDTSALVDAIIEPAHLATVEHLVTLGEPLRLSAVVLYEWLRGPRTAAELTIQERLFPAARIVPFGDVEARQAALLYRVVRGARGREIDLMIAATALVHGARLWTLNRKDFADIPGLVLYA